MTALCCGTLRTVEIKESVPRQTEFHGLAVVKFPITDRFGNLYVGGVSIDVNLAGTCGNMLARERADVPGKCLTKRLRNGRSGYKRQCAPDQ